MYSQVICSTVLNGLGDLLLYVKLNLRVNGKHKKSILFNTPYFGVFGGASTKFANVGNYSFQV